MTPPNHIPLVYRPELQGIRAIAVLSVLLFHFGFSGIEGGYLGVDIFFVLSGFLITSILGKSGQALSLPDLRFFLVKRFWRIVPSLFFVVFLTMVTGWLILIPEDYSRLSYEALSTLTFVSNHFFAQQAGYFDVSAGLKPLLHGWSLSVELQFYVVWAVLFFFVFRRDGLSFNGWIAILFVLSLLANIILIVRDPDIVFFILPTRGWEFAIGALAALHQGRIFLKRFSSWAGVINIGAFGIIITMIVAADTAVPAQLQYTLPLCLAVAVLIVMLPHNVAITQFLSLPFLAWIGIISYSLYLIHWPMIVMANYLFFPVPPRWLSAFLFFACFPLAHLLYRFVEEPMRLYGRAQKERGALKATLPLVLVSGVLSGLCLAIISSGGAPGRYDRAAQERIRHPYQSQETGLKERITGQEQPKIKVVKNRQDAKGVAVWGDSHAGHFYGAIERFLSRKGIQTFSFSQSSCVPLSGVIMKYSYWNPVRKCSKEKTNRVMEQIISSPKITTVILAARWVTHLECHALEGDSYRPVFFTKGNSDVLTCENSQRIFREAFLQMVSRLLAHGKKVIIMGQVPEFGFDAARCSILRAANSLPLTPCYLSRAKVRQRHKSMDDFFGTLAATHKDIEYIRTMPEFCKDEFCRPALENRLAYKDDDHILPSAARFLVDKYFALLPENFWSVPIK